MKECPNCRKNIILFVFQKTLKPLEEDFENNSRCPNCNHNLKIGLPDFLRSKFSVPFGVGVGVITSNIVLYKFSGTITYKILLISSVCFILFFIYWLVGAILTKVEKC